MAFHERHKRAQQLKDLFAKAPMKKTFGMELTFDGDGRAQFEMAHNPSLEHALGDTHGGVIATLLDNAGWFTAAVQYDTWIATVEMQIRLLEPAGREGLRASGKLIRAGKSLATASMEVRSESGRLVAMGSGTFAVTSKKA